MVCPAGYYLPEGSDQGYRAVVKIIKPGIMREAVGSYVLNKVQGDIVLSVCTLFFYILYYFVGGLL